MSSHSHWVTSLLTRKDFFLWPKHLLSTLGGDSSDAQESAWHAIVLVFLATLTSFGPPVCARNLPESTGADTSQVGTVDALVPVLQWRKDLYDDPIEDGSFRHLPISIPRDEKSFKRVLDTYSQPVSYKQKFMDNNAFLVYYTQGYDGPNRPNLEEQDSVQEKQTLQYGARNDAWVAWENLLVEFDFVQRNPEEVDSSDLRDLWKKAVMALDAYIKLAPPDQVEAASRMADAYR